MLATRKKSYHTILMLHLQAERSCLTFVRLPLQIRPLPCDVCLGCADGAWLSAAAENWLGFFTNWPLENGSRHNKNRN